MILRPVKPVSPCGRDDETSGRVDEKFGLLREQTLGQNFFHDVLDANFSISRCSTSALCCVEMTTLEMAPGFVVHVTTETCDFASGRSHGTLPVLRMRVSSRPRRWANMMGAGISSGVSLQA